MSLPEKRVCACAHVLERLEAERDEWRRQYTAATNERIALQALLARRPHLAQDEGSDDHHRVDFIILEDSPEMILHSEEQCARLGGACAK